MKSILLAISCGLILSFAGAQRLGQIPNFKSPPSGNSEPPLQLPSHFGNKRPPQFDRFPPGRPYPGKFPPYPRPPSGEPGPLQFPPNKRPPLLDRPFLPFPPNKRPPVPDVPYPRPEPAPPFPPNKRPPPPDRPSRPFPPNKRPPMPDLPYPPPSVEPAPRPFPPNKRPPVPDLPYPPPSVEPAPLPRPPSQRPSLPDRPPFPSPPNQLPNPIYPPQEPEPGRPEPPSQVPRPTEPQQNPPVKQRPGHKKHRAKPRSGELVEESEESVEEPKADDQPIEKGKSNSGDHAKRPGTLGGKYIKYLAAVPLPAPWVPHYPYIEPYPHPLYVVPIPAFKRPPSPEGQENQSVKGQKEPQVGSRSAELVEESRDDDQPIVEDKSDERKYTKRPGGRSGKLISYLAALSLSAPWLSHYPYIGPYPHPPYDPWFPFPYFRK